LEVAYRPPRSMTKNEKHRHDNNSVEFVQLLITLPSSTLQLLKPKIFDLCFDGKQLELCPSGLLAFNGQHISNVLLSLCEGCCDMMHFVHCLL
jgi:hypothetical protein